MLSLHLRVSGRRLLRLLADRLGLVLLGGGQLLVQVELDLRHRHGDGSLLLRRPQTLSLALISVLELLVRVSGRRELLRGLLLLSALDFASVETASRIMPVLVLIAFVAGHVGSSLKLALARVASDFVLCPSQLIHHAGRLDRILLPLLVIRSWVIQCIRIHIRVIGLLVFSLVLCDSVRHPIKKSLHLSVTWHVVGLDLRLRQFQLRYLVECHEVLILFLLTLLRKAVACVWVLGLSIRTNTRRIIQFFEVTHHVLVWMLSAW